MECWALLADSEQSTEESAWRRQGHITRLYVQFTFSEQMYRERQEVFLPTVRLLQQLVIAHKLTKVGTEGSLRCTFTRNCSFMLMLCSTNVLYLKIA